MERHLNCKYVPKNEVPAIDSTFSWFRILWHQFISMEDFLHIIPNEKMDENVTKRPWVP
jgi:hypothetical protein